MILNISTAFSDMMRTLSIYIYRYSCHKLIKYASLNLYIKHCCFCLTGTQTVGAQHYCAAFPATHQQVKNKSEDYCHVK